MKELATLQSGAGQGRKRVRVLFTCAGRRIELITAFIRAAKSLGIKLDLHTADAEAYYAGSCVANRSHKIPLAGSSDYVPALLKIAKREKIDLLIPLLDMELLKLAQARRVFAEVGCNALISSPRVIKICRDKLNTFEFFSSHGIDTPQTWTAVEISRQRRHHFPYFLKPRQGSASMGNHVIRNKADLVGLVPGVKDAIVQEFVPGVEHTLDVYTGYDGKPRCVVPRERVEVRGGEVTKSRTVKHQGVIDMGVLVAEALADCVGVITIQLILTPDQRIRVIEVNPRFGGGVPLAIHAGADFPKWLLAEWLGKKPRIRLAHFRDGVMMLRYHQSFFKEGVLTRQAKLKRG